MASLTVIYNQKSVNIQCLNRNYNQAVNVSNEIDPCLLGRQLTLASSLLIIHIPSHVQTHILYTDSHTYITAYTVPCQSIYTSSFFCTLLLLPCVKPPPPTSVYTPYTILKKQKLSSHNFVNIYIYLNSNKYIA